MLPTVAALEKGLVVGKPSETRPFFFRNIEGTTSYGFIAEFMNKAVPDLI